MFHCFENMLEIDLIHPMILHTGYAVLNTCLTNVMSSSYFLVKENPSQLQLLSLSGSQVLRPSNHATLQSIVRAVGIVPGIPEPCCVPDRMSSLSVLFLDPSRNMVLKVYPNMSVETCGCR